MKSFLKYIFIAVIIFGVFSPVVDAQMGNLQPMASQLAARQGDSTLGESLLGGIFGTAGEWLTSIFAWVGYEILIKITAWILGLSGILLDQVISTTIITMTQKVNAMTGINTAWQITRDLMNIAFIFLLIYEGIKLIIGSGSSTEIKKLITGIVLASLLINFSLFFTKVLIDASNIVTIGLYNATISGGGTSIGGGNVGVTNLSVGLSAPYMQALGFTSMFTNTSFLSVVGNAGGGTQTLIFSIMGAILFLVTSFVFFAISVMLIVRYIVLIILMMLSPVAYMGLALPFMKPYANQWWESLKGQLLFAPIFMFMSLIVLTLMSSPNFITITGGGVSNWGEIVNPGGGAGGGAVGLLINFAVIIGLTIGSLIIAKSTASKGSDMIKTVTGKAGAYAGGLVMGGTARLGRATVGRAGNAISNSERLKNMEVEGNVLTRNLARYGRVGGTKLATSSLDVRGASAYKTLEESAGMKNYFGKAPDAKKVNFQKIREDKAEKEANYAKSLKPSDEEKERIKQQTGHSDLEDKEKNIKTNFETATKEANELLEKKQNAQKELEKAESDLANITEEKEIAEAKIKIDTIKTKIKDADENREIQIKNRDKFKKELDEVAEKIKESQKNLDKIYSERVEAYAGLVENESRMSIYAKNIFKIPFTGSFGTSGDNKFIAKKIREKNKEKSKKEKLADLALEVAKEDGDTPKEEPKKEAGGEGEKKEGGEGEAKTT